MWWPPRRSAGRRFEAHPRDVNLLALLGALQIKLNRLDDAETLLRTAIARAPKFAKPHEDLGRLLVQQGRPDEAVPLLEHATQLDPKLEDAWFALGKALAALGRGAEADKAFERCFALSPERRIMALAAEHQKEGRLEDAEHFYRRVLRQNPRNVDALRLLALIAAGAGPRGRSGKPAAARRLRWRPITSLAHTRPGSIAKEQDRYREALECFDRALALDSNNDQVHFLRASTLAPAAFTHEAIEAYREDACSSSPGTSAPCSASATCSRPWGAITMPSHPTTPAFGSAPKSARRTGASRTSRPIASTMRRSPRWSGVRSPAGAPCNPTVNFLFALAKAYEDRGDFERAWELYRAGQHAAARARCRTTRCRPRT